MSLFVYLLAWFGVVETLVAQAGLQHIIPRFSLLGAGMIGKFQHSRPSISLGLCGGSEILVTLKPG